MNRQRLLLFAAALAASFAGCNSIRPDYAARAATGTTAHDIYSEAFVSGQPPATIFDETIASRPGLHWIAPLIHFDVDRTRHTVSASLADMFTSRAVYRGPWGCMLVSGKIPAAQEAPQALSLVPDVPLPVANDGSAAMTRALDDAFAENTAAAPRRTKAVAVLYRGTLIAERYAPGYGPDTPILGFSVSKSVTNALVGILVREGRLRIDTPVPLDNGSSSPIPLADFMRMTARPVLGV